jgi:hypothetical protein
MIRRWSYIIDLNNCNFSSNLHIEKRYNVNIFKTSVSYKKFVSKITRFRRKSLRRFKHQSNWLMYTNVIRYWIKDFMFNKQYLRFQFFNKIFINNFFFFNFNFYKIKNENFFLNFNFYFAIWTKKSYFYFKSFYNSYRYFKNNNITVGWTLNEPTQDKSIIPTLSEWDNSFFFMKTNKNYEYDITQIFDFFFFFYLQKIIEIRKILTLLHYYNTKNY